MPIVQHGEGLDALKQTSHLYKVLVPTMRPAHISDSRVQLHHRRNTNTANFAREPWPAAGSFSPCLNHWSNNFHVFQHLVLALFGSFALKDIRPEFRCSLQAAA